MNKFSKTVADYVSLDKFDLVSNYKPTDIILRESEITVKCKQHNKIFTTKAYNVFRGCDDCKYEHHYKWKKDWRHIDQEEIIRRCKELHPEYDYSEVEYINATTPIKIICPKHGAFMKTVANFTHKTRPQGCPKCGIEKRASKRVVDREVYITEIQKQFPYDTLDFTKIRECKDYNGVRSYITFTCIKHGDWNSTFNDAFWTHSAYLCPICRQHNKKLSAFAKLVRVALNELDVEYKPEQRFPEWLIYKQPMWLDFYIPKANLAIEVQGGQHFYYCSKYQKTINDFKILQEKDKLKYDLCKEHGIEVIYFAKASDIKNVKEYHNIIFTDLNELKSYIMNLI